MDADFERKLLEAYSRSTRFLTEHQCPRGIESGREGKAVWTVGDSCSFCGSLHPDVFMERIEAGDVMLEPTDKNYKVYVNADAGSKDFKQTFRGEGDPGGSDPSKWVWTTREDNHAKFYYQHLSLVQRERFVQLLNEKKLKLDYPGWFYRMPFFIESVVEA